MSTYRNILLRKFSIYSICFGLGAVQTILFVFGGYAQAPTAQNSAPVDIQATEEEFLDDQVVAKGNVKVTYKDSIVHAPMARLFRDAEGQPQRAIFVGHSVLVQGDSTIMGDTLIFEISSSKVIAQGNAHSEVDSSTDDSGSSTANKGGSSSANKPATNIQANSSTNGQIKTNQSKPSQTKSAQAGKPDFKWPQQGDEFDQATNTVENSSKVESEGSNPSEATTANNSASKTGSESKKPPTSTAVEKIITDSDLQEYEKESGKFDASGHVHVINGDISIYADKLRLVYGTDGKPETALFSGHVDATRNANNTKSDLMTYYLVTKRLQATGNVRSKVIEKAPANQKNGKSGTADDTAKQNTVGAVPIANGGAAEASTAKKSDEDNTILIVSDAQDNSELTGRMTAEGNVKVYYQNTVGVGPKALLVRNAQGQAERVIFNGRSQITQPGKRWIADRLTFTPATKKVLAEGNTRAFIFQAPPEKNQESTVLASKPKSSSDDNKSTSTNNSPTAVSSSKVEPVR